MISINSEHGELPDPRVLARFNPANSTMQIATWVENGRINAELTIGTEEKQKWVVPTVLHDLDQEHESIVQLLKAVTTPETDQESIQRLADAGRYFFALLFGTDDPYCVAAKEVFLSKINSGQIRSLHCHSKGFALPWQIVYLGEPNTPADPTKFLGVMVSITKTFHERGSFRHRKKDDLPKDVYFSFSEKLNGIQEDELELLMHLEANGTFRPDAFVTAEEIMGNESEYDRAKFFVDGACASNAHFVHISCHANYGTKARQRVFEVRNSARITDHELVANDFRFDKKHRPIIVLNACESGEMGILTQSGFPKTFIDMGATAFIGTDTKVHTKSAGAFASQFYEHFFSGQQSLARAIHSTTKELAAQGSLIGLAYSCFGYGDFQLYEEQ